MKQRWTIITGASEGIGKQCAIDLAANDHPLLLISRSEKKLTNLKKLLNQSHSVAIEILPCDLSKPESIDVIYQWCCERNADIKLLINNAGGVIESKKFNQLTRGDWLHTFELNLFSVVSIIDTVLSFMKENGRIINISSINAKSPGYLNPHYSAAKSALNNYTKHLSNHIADRNITINTVSPGIIETEGWHEHTRKSASDANQPHEKFLNKTKSSLSNTIPAGRLGTAEDVSALVVFLSSDAASYITGSDFVVDGGKRKEI